MIWFSMAPAFFAVIYLWRGANRPWQWCLVPIVVTLPLVFVAKLAAEAMQTADTEWWTGHAVNAEYYESWEEEVQCRHPKYKTVTKTRTVTDSKGNSRTETYTEQEQDGYEHAYDVDYHPPYWEVHDNNGQTIGVSHNHFEALAKKFKSRQFEALHRFRQHSFGDGNKYVATWPGDDATLEVVTTQHHYKNKVIASNSVFKFPEVKNPKELGLFDYPEVRNFYETPFILGHEDPVAGRKLALWNAHHGKEKQCRLLFLIFKDAPIDRGLDQENYWQGGNKNEFVVCIGVSGEKINWCHIISWTEEEKLKVQVRDHVMASKTLALPALVDKVGEMVQGQFQRKHFKDFDYLTVEPPTWAILLTLFLAGLANAGTCFGIVNKVPIATSTSDASWRFRDGPLSRQ